MNTKKLIAGVLACCAVGGVIPSAVYRIPCAVTANAEDEAEYTERTYGQLTYKHYGDYIEISDCDEKATEVKIPSEIGGVPVTGIGDFTFSSCETLTSVTIPDSVTSIGRAAFSLCYDLTSITIPDSVTSISDMAFYSCNSLTSITLSENLKNFEEGIFAYCESLESINIPDSVTTIGNNVFYGCYALTSVTIPENVESIGEEAFAYCPVLTEIRILNPECEIYDSNDTIANRYTDEDYVNCYFNGTIYGYENSTAQAYAEKYGRKFESLGEVPEKEKMFGDIDGNGKIDASDASLILSYYAYTSTGGKDSFEEYLKSAK